MLLDFTTYPEKPFPQPETPFEAKVLAFLDEWFSEMETVPVQTSGSTGAPKIFEIEKNRMRSSAKMTCDFLGLKANSTALLCLPVEYISGKMMVVRAIEGKLKLIVATPSTKPLQEITQTIQFCAMTPLQVENSLDKIHLIENLIIGGAQVAEHLKRSIHQTLKNSESSSRTYETYGMSETLSHIALKQIHPETEDYFTVLNGVKIGLDDRGCLSVLAPHLNPEKLQTNDLVEIQNELQFRFLGRVDNIINSAGLKIHPEQLEELVKKHVTQDVLFVGLHDATFGEKLVLAIEGENSKQLFADIASAIDTIETTFSKNHRPRGVFCLKEFPRLPNGKINRRAVPAMLQS